MKPLSKKTRLISGGLLTLVFIILAPLLLANSFGYHFNKIQDVFTLVKTGGIYVMSDISGIEIFVDDEYFNDGGIFLRNVKIQDLNPNKYYQIVAQKEGYHDWRKVLAVYESIMTESRVLMLPIEIETNEIFPFFDELNVGTTTAPLGLKKNIELSDEALVGGYVPSNSEYRNLINLFSEDDDVYSTTTSLIVDDLEIEDVNATSTKTEKNIPDYFIDLGIEDPDELDNLIVGSNQVSWLENGNIILNWIDDNTPNFYYCLELNSCRTKTVIDWQDDILGFDFLPGRDDAFIVLVSSGVYAIEADDRSERNIQPIYLGENLDFIKNDQDLIIVKDKNVFHEINL